MFKSYKNTNSQAPAKILLDKLVSDEFPIDRDSDKEIHSHLNYLLWLWKKYLRS